MIYWCNKLVFCLPWWNFVVLTVLQCHFLPLGNKNNEWICHLLASLHVFLFMKTSNNKFLNQTLQVAAIFRWSHCLSDFFHVIFHNVFSINYWTKLSPLIYCICTLYTLHVKKINYSSREASQTIRESGEMCLWVPTANFCQPVVSKEPRW